MAAEHGALPEGISPPVMLHALARERLSPVPAFRPAVFRTFAEGVQVLGYGPVWHRQRSLVPDGLVHAAGLAGREALCGRPLQTLHEFGRSRHPFERVEESRRCPECDLAAGHPTD
jgi:hypothetical protein